MMQMPIHFELTARSLCNTVNLFCQRQEIGWGYDFHTCSVSTLKVVDIDGYEIVTPCLHRGLILVTIL